LYGVLQAEYGTHLFVESVDVALLELFSDKIQKMLATPVRQGAVPLVRCLERFFREDGVRVLRALLLALAYPPLHTDDCKESNRSWIDDSKLFKKISGHVVRYAVEANGPQMPKRRNGSSVSPSSLVDFLAAKIPQECKALIDAYIPVGPDNPQSLISTMWQKIDEAKGKCS
jgi:hypothetical protein